MLRPVPPRKGLHLEAILVVYRTAHFELTNVHVCTRLDSDQLAIHFEDDVVDLFTKGGVITVPSASSRWNLHGKGIREHLIACEDIGVEQHGGGERGMALGSGDLLFKNLAIILSYT